ncbi:hypothetical protein CPB83DRAFT_858212 [Crepidotus variabilis]|uniref:Uncharacterized protein n=1 Tax=Crepidotus variabilis TaxID=179855 RepID=A0A9P6JN02_9AGAR|nr:hypothetical protein CPB83DRAFT_858212 [Crepidotus variabilis]
MVDQPNHIKAAYAVEYSPEPTSFSALPKMQLLTLFPIFILAISVAATPIIDETYCPGAKIVSETYIGKDKNVQVLSLSCDTLPRIAPKENVVLPRAANVLNVCASHCNNNCFLPAGGGPDPNECHVISDALLYEGQNTGAIFQVQNGTVAGNPTVMQYRSCKTFFVNQDTQILEFCRSTWAGLVDSLAFNCQAAQNAHGGNCVADDQRWYVQVQSSTAP